MPAKRGIKPSYEQKTFSEADKRGRLRARRVARRARAGSLAIHTDAQVYAGLFDKGESAELALAPKRHAWIHVARGTAKVNGQELAAGDGAAFTDERTIAIEGVAGAEVLAFDLA